jgi:hypothetical protein
MNADFQSMKKAGPFRAKPPSTQRKAGLPVLMPRLEDLLGVLCVFA